MKNRIVIRLLLVLYILISFFLVGVILSGIWGFTSLSATAKWLELVVQKSWGMWLVSVLCVFVILFGFVLMFARFNKKPPKAHELQKGDYGTISVTIAAIEEIARRYFSEMREIRSLNLRVQSAKLGLKVFVKLSVAPNTNIPELTVKIQNELKEHVEAYTGLAVLSIDISVLDSTLSEK